MFSVLMSLYCKELPCFLEECLISIQGQTIQPNDIVIVEDGPLTIELYNMLDKWEGILPIKRVKLSVNVGLGKALNYGMEYCDFDIIARMDTDDICLPRRFEKQLQKFTNSDVDICGSWVSEFDVNCDALTSYRTLPETHDEILQFSRFKNPLNHPSVMYRKSVVLEVNGYENVLYFEDYHLWLKLMANGFKFYNIQEPLVSMRAGLGQLSRRGGFKYALLELEFLKRCSREGLMSKAQLMVNAITRFPIRLLPPKVLGKVYRFIRSK
ncbi:glycosyltransferase [Shewanella woodyi]|uniref:glycosyltransferase n=1 Tax=Shewanella woodyi TaxID=60961 RepID=UPI0009EE1FF8|nr:glycosyltransferase [Shewanella woodyi]